MVKIITPQKIESQNKFNNKYGNLWAYKKYKQMWESAIGDSLIGENFDKVKEKRTVIIISVRAKLLDYGNLVGGCKPVLDILQDWNILYNDSPEWCNDEYFQSVETKNQHTEIIIF